MYPTFSKEMNTLLMASVAPLDCKSKSLNLMPAKFSQNFPEAPPTASCKVAQGIVPGHFFFSTTLLRVKTVCSCHPFMVALTICFMCITTISECYHLSFIIQFFFLYVCLKIVFCIFYMHIIEIMEMPLSHICPLLICWFPSCFLFALTLK